MPPLLPQRSWRIRYASNNSNPIADFYIPALECAVRYDRKAGFFNSAVLSKVARGLGAMLQNNGQMRLIMGCQFSPQDLTAIQEGYQLREILWQRLDLNLTPPDTLLQLKHFEILSWLIANYFLEIKIAVPLQDAQIPDALDTHHLFHEKSGIFTDADNHQIAFNGSNNESLSGWEQNVESFHVYCSWDGEKDLERVNEEQAQFEQLWYGLAPNVKVFDIPEAIKQKLLRYTPETKPIWSKQVEDEDRPLTTPTKPITPQQAPISETEQQQWRALKNLHQHPGCLDYCLKSIPIQPWVHQLKILRRFIADYPQSTIICDEVGLGKTISASLIIRYLLVSRQAQRVLILVPASVQPQWHEELREKFNLHFWSYEKGRFSRSRSESEPAQGNPWEQKDLILASSHLIRREDRAAELLAAADWDLIILDEAHHARRSGPQSREDTPNNLLRLMRELKHKTKSLVLLTATPMQIDTIEVFDLLNLLGLKGQWQYEDNFCAYFDRLSYPPDRLRLEFWQKMSVDYFRQGGQLCSIWEKHLTEGNRLLLYRLLDIWHNNQSLSNTKQLCQDTEFIAQSRQLLTLHTPLKDLMFRHTRDTLRQYYRLGILAQDVPTRLVFDQAIALETSREVPLYRAVSDYVRYFYNLAQQENRKGLGFLMTLYRRRLTSSFYAIRKSLERRLEGISSISDDDLADIEEADDRVIEGLEKEVNSTSPDEIAYLEELLQQFENTGEDSKLSAFLTILRQELQDRESAIVFFQYTDTMDYVRDTLSQLYGNQVACYSGRGGERYEDGQWHIVKKELIKHQFREGKVKILLCTKSASEGLNLQICGVIIMYSMPWNPMQVEQQIGRLDRIGQIHSTIRIHNFYYDGTVEAKVYSRLRHRIHAFETVVGNLQPILAQIPTFIERAIMAADPEEEGVLFSEFDQKLSNPPLRPDLETMVAMNVEADVAFTQQALSPSPITPDSLEQLFTQSFALSNKGIDFIPQASHLWTLKMAQNNYQVTFFPEIYDEHPSVHLMTYGDPIFESLLNQVII